MLTSIVLVTTSSAAWLRPLEGSGNFYCTVDQFTRQQADGTFDLVLCFSVPNNEVTFVQRDGRLVGDLSIFAELTGINGSVITGTKSVLLQTANRDEAGSPAMNQVFPVILRGIDAAAGRLLCRVEDMNRKRSGLLNQMQSKVARSEFVTDWDAPPREADPVGLAVGGPVFLSGAPLDHWRQTAATSRTLSEFDYLHPNRRYGLAQERLQLFFEVQPPGQGAGRDAAVAGLFLQIMGKDLRFALRDTIRFDESSLALLDRGGTAGVYYELDVNDLPPGVYQLSCAPANGQGRGWLTEFDVAWSLSGLNRHSDEIRGEGYTVFNGDELDVFIDAGQAEREVMLERFWSEHDPDIDTPINEAYLEFRRRVAHVTRNLGGFGRSGAIDPRGTVYVLLGPPDDIQIETMPLNDSEFNDAIVKVFDPYAPDRVGTQAKGAYSSGTHGRQPDESTGGIPMAQTYQSRREVAARRHKIARDKGFELWKYNYTGWQLFPNLYSYQGLGMSFLFVDRSGSGSYVLEATNAMSVSD
ncbi:MAG: GWxTD domain-containing protein [bacterium]